MNENIIKQPLLPDTIQFYHTKDNDRTEVMRITRDGVWVNPDMAVDETAKAVLDALDYQVKVLVQRAVGDEREACAKLCLEGTDMPVQVDALKIIRAERERISNAIRARGIDVAKVGEVGVWGDKREWVGLTDEEREFFKGIGFVGVDIIETKLKEKNT